VKSELVDASMTRAVLSCLVAFLLGGCAAQLAAQRIDKECVDSGYQPGTDPTYALCREILAAEGKQASAR
jgi:hypothetical protein